jgi:hypothetical protein
MRRTLPGSFLCLMAAGGLGLTSALAAGANPEPRSVTSSATAVTATVVHPSQAALEAMRVEMAWLADLSLFGHPLRVQARTDVIELHGTLPDETLHQHAIRIARQNSYMPVADLIQLEQHATAPQAAAEEIHRLVVAQLVKEFGERATGFEVSVRPDGRINIRGSVLSVEDKLAISRSLRPVPGCKAVCNDLTVTPILRAGVPVTLVTRDGSHAVRGGIPPFTEEVSTAGALKTRQAVTGGHEGEADLQLPSVVYPSPATRVSGPILLPPAPTLVLPSGLPAIRPAQAHKSKAVSSGTQTLEVIPTPVTAPARSIVILTGSSTSVPASEGIIPATPPASATQAVTSDTAPAPRKTLWERITARRPATQRTTVKAVAVTTVERTQTPGIVATPQVVTKAAATPNPWPPAYSVRPVISPAEQPAPEPIKATVNTQVAAPALVQLPATAAPTLTPTPTPAPTQATVKLDATRLMRQIQQACGSTVRKVQVVQMRDKSLRVIVQVANAASEKEAVEKILHLPEMALPGIVLEINVGP